MTRLNSLMSLKGRRALITGGAGHIAVAMAETLAELGASLILVDREAERLTSVANDLEETWQIPVRSFVCDLESEIDRNGVIEAVFADEFGSTS